MNVNAIDLVISLVIFIAVWLGFKRGFGKSIFDFVAVLIALRLASMYHVALGEGIHLSSETQANHALLFVISFVVIGAILWFIGKLVYDATLLSLDTFDPPLGAVLGFGIAVMLSHVVSKSLFIAAHVKEAVPPVIKTSTLGYEFLEFPLYHSIVDVMFRLGQ